MKDKWVIFLILKSSRMYTWKLVPCWIAGIEPIKSTAEFCTAEEARADAKEIATKFGINL